MLSDEHLKTLQGLVNAVSNLQLNIGRLEGQKHNLLHELFGINSKIAEMQDVFTKEYGTNDINVMDGTINKAKDETATKNLESAHMLQDKIRNVVFSQEQISFMKAILKIRTKNNIWDTMMPPLVSLNNLEKNKNIIAIMKLLDEMNELSSNF